VKSDQRFVGEEIEKERRKLKGEMRTKVIW
jgi:hypothetical protein